jgi:hypothetical protein
MKLSYKLLVMLLLLCQILANAQTRPSMCRIFPLWIGIDDGLRSSYSNDVGRFQLEGKEGATVHSFNYNGLVINAGIDYAFMYSKRKHIPYRINLAITVSDKEEKKIFESVNSSEASTLYKKGWNLQVTKNANLGNKMFMFTLSCNDGLELPKRY